MHRGIQRVASRAVTSAPRVAQKCLRTNRSCVSLSTRPCARRFLTSAAEADSKTKSEFGFRRGAATASGVADMQRINTVRIFKPAREPMQQGAFLEESRKWKLVFRDRDDVQRWKDPMMGWTAEDCTMNQINLSFSSKEQAIEYCKTNGYDFEVEEPKQARRRIKSYSDNYAAKNYGMVAKRKKKT